MANLLPKKWVVLWAVMVLCPLSTAQQTIYYLPFDETFSEQIILQEARTTAYEGEKLLSPNQLGFVQLLQPTFSEKAPWSTTLFIQHTNGKTLHLDLLNHANIHPRTTWINDELLYIKVWWGRVLGTELILDLKNSTFIYKRMFAYDLYSFSQKANSSQHFVFKLEHVQGATPPDFKSFELISLDTEFDSIRQITIETSAPMSSNCYLDVSSSTIQAFESFIESFLQELRNSQPPRPLETVCRNCSIYEMTWVYQSESGSFLFTEQRPFRYPALDYLFPLIKQELNRMPTEAECDAEVKLHFSLHVDS